MAKVVARRSNVVVKSGDVADFLQANLTVEGMATIAQKELPNFAESYEFYGLPQVNYFIERAKPEHTRKPNKKQTPKRKSEPEGKIVLAPAPRAGYFERVKRELRILICTDDKKYAKLRKTMTSKNNERAIIAAIAAGVGAVLGLAAAIVMPFVAMAMMFFLQVGKNAYCSA